MKQLFIIILLLFSFGLCAQSFDATKLTMEQKRELALLTEGCKKTKVVYTDEKGRKFPVYYDFAQRTTFYVFLYKGHIKTVDIGRRVAFVD